MLLQGLLQNCGAAVRLMKHCRDDEELLTKALKRAIEHRVVIISGGVSVGERDIWRVAIKPGKPFLFGHIGECALFGLHPFFTLAIRRPSAWFHHRSRDFAPPCRVFHLGADYPNLWF